MHADPVKWRLLMLFGAVECLARTWVYAEPLQDHQPGVVTECGSLFDDVKSCASSITREDKRGAIDDCVESDGRLRCSGRSRWCPFNQPLSGALIKDMWHPTGLLRASVQSGKDHCVVDANVLPTKAADRDRRREVCLGLLWDVLLVFHL